MMRKQWKTFGAIVMTTKNHLPTTGDEIAPCAGNVCLDLRQCKRSKHQHTSRPQPCGHERARGRRGSEKRGGRRRAWRAEDSLVISYFDDQRLQCAFGTQDD